MIFNVNVNLALLIGLPALLLLLALLWRKRSPSYWLFFSIFYFYLLLVLVAILFPIPIGARPYASDLRDYLERINLRPFYFGPFAYMEYRQVLINQITNILLTIPFGFGINFIARLKKRYYLWIPIATGAGLEGLQLVANILVRQPYRVIDINDVILNALGVWIGYGIFRLFAWGYLAFYDNLKPKHGGVLAFIYNVAATAQTGKHSTPTG
jgi:glycopeptide antibiotics resistance protein